MRSTSDCLKIAKAASCSEVHPLSRTKRVAMSPARKGRFCRHFSLSELVSHSRFSQRTLILSCISPGSLVLPPRESRPVYTISSNRTAWNKLTEAGLQRILPCLSHNSQFSIFKNRKERKSWKHHHKPLTRHPSVSRTRTNQHLWATRRSSGSWYWLAS